LDSFVSISIEGRVPSPPPNDDIDPIEIKDIPDPFLMNYNPPLIGPNSLILLHDQNFENMNDIVNPFY